MDFLEVLVLVALCGEAKKKFDATEMMMMLSKLLVLGVGGVLMMALTIFIY